MRQNDRQPKEFEEKVVKITRVSKKTKGGNKIGFTALVVIGDRKGKVGVALGKANDVLSAIKKGVRRAKKKLIKVPLHGTTIPFEIYLKDGAAKVLLKPAPEGTGVIAGGSMRSVLELAGVRNVVAKTLGSPNKMSNVTATFKALSSIKQTVDLKKDLNQLPRVKSSTNTVKTKSPVKSPKSDESSPKASKPTKKATKK